MKKVLNRFFVSMLLACGIACNNYNNAYNGGPSAAASASGLTFRAFVSNPVEPLQNGGGAPVVNIVNASTDVLNVATIPLTSIGSTVHDAGMMALSPKRDRTLVMSPSDGKLAIINNAQQSTTSAVTLGGSSESFFVWNDDKTAYAAVPDASIPGHAPGAVEVIDIPTARVTATIPVPSAHYVVPSPNGNVILVFSENSDAVTMLTPSLIGVSGESSTQLPCSSTQLMACVLPGSFDRPVWAVFNADGSTAYVLNCGQQCGGTGIGACLTFTSCTSVSVLDMTQGPPASTASVAVPAATMAILQGNNLFVAGTPFLAADNACTGVTTTATSCGRLTVINVPALTAASAVAITDGYHNKMRVTPDGQLFIGARNCSNVNISGGEVRGCLSILNSTAGAVSASNVIVPHDNGDVTGMEPVPGRTVVYVCEGGNLRVYDTTTDQLQVFHQPNVAPNVAGQAIDVKIVDF